jgi:hypothetical protein
LMGMAGWIIIYTLIFYLSNSTFTARNIISDFLFIFSLLLHKILQFFPFTSNLSHIFLIASLLNADKIDTPHQSPMYQLYKLIPRITLQ